MTRKPDLLAEAEAKMAVIDLVLTRIQMQLQELMSEVLTLADEMAVSSDPASNFAHRVRQLAGRI